MILYTTNCPKCNVLKQKLIAKSIGFEISEDISEMTRLGMMSSPYLEIDGRFLNFSEAVKYINEL